MSRETGLIRILTVDDHPLLREGIAALVNAEPDMKLVAEASNGQEAIEKFRAHRPDVTLMDLQMPVMNGFDAAKEIRKLPDPKKAGIPIIALTAAALTDIREQVLNAGMNDYVSKPFKPEDLMEKIHGLVVAVH